MFRNLGLLASVVGLGVFAIGCDAPVANFRLNRAFERKMEIANLGDEKAHLSTQQVQDVAEILTALFGTPDDPNMPAVEGVDVAKVADPYLLKIAAGKVGSDQNGVAHGLYREHCVHCHGISGDGAGPTAYFLNPYPRDYRPGIYKFKSTKKGAKPTHDDLMKTLKNGIAGTAMPSFALLDDQELDALAAYVRYLSIRGEVERKIWTYATADLENDPEKNEFPRLFEVTDDQDKLKEQLAPYVEMVNEVVANWVAPEPVAIAAPKKELQVQDVESIARGRALFYGQIANCVSCHGESGLGDGQRDFYDDWSGEWVEKGKPQLTAEYVALGVMPPRNLIPRNLRLGVYRGGHRPIDLYWRITNGIEGAQMPAAPMKAADAGPEVKGLTPSDVWDLINYVRAMPYEALSQPPAQQSPVAKENL